MARSNLNAVFELFRPKTLKNSPEHPQSHKKGYIRVSEQKNVFLNFFGKNCLKNSGFRGFIRNGFRDGLRIGFDLPFIKHVRDLNNCVNFFGTKALFKIGNLLKVKNLKGVGEYACSKSNTFKCKVKLLTLHLFP